MVEIGPRIVGTEMEWPVSVRLVGSAEFRPFVGVSSMFENLPPGLRSVGASQGNKTNTMLGNGARYYLDAGNWVEYATPENTSFAGCVEDELAGEYVVMHAVAAVMAKRDDIEEVYLQKNAIDDFLQGWGYHINLSAYREAFPNIPKHTGLLLAHLATSWALFGAGKLYERNEKGVKKVVYSLGQKVLSLTSDYDIGTQNEKKPLINMRDESHADETIYRRMHIVGTDPNISPWALCMKLGTSSMMLSAKEQGKASDFRLSSEYNANSPASHVAKLVAHDPTFDMLLRLEDGRTITVTDLQAELIGVAESIERTDEESAVLVEWRRAVEDLKRDPMLLRDRSDAIAKLDLLRGMQAKHGLDTFDDPRIRLADLRYGTLMRINKNLPNLSGTDVVPLRNATIAHKLRTGRFAANMPSEQAIMHAVQNPPTTTRAYKRGKLITDHGDKISNVTWTSYKRRGNQNANTHTMLDPFNSSLEDFE